MNDKRVNREADFGIPSPVILYLSGAYAIAAVALLLRSMFTIFADSQNIWWVIIAAVAIAGISYGTFASLRQTNLDRILVYLSLAHMSYVLLGVVAANEGAATAMTYYLFTYLFIATGVFGVLVAVCGKNTSWGVLKDLSGLRQAESGHRAAIDNFCAYARGRPAYCGIFWALLHISRAAGDWAPLYSVVCRGVIVGSRVFLFARWSVCMARAANRKRDPGRLLLVFRKRSY